MLAWLLGEAGYSVEEASGGAEALAHLEQNPPDCMVLDLMMPGVDGQAVLQRRQQTGLAPQTRILVLTAKNDHSTEVWCWERGADEYVTKPFEGERLIKLVRDLMGLSNEQLSHRREVGLAEARRLDALDRAFPGSRTGRRLR